MKSTKNILIASAMVMLSTQAIADETYSSKQTVVTADATSKVAAYEQALTKLDSLKVASANELQKDFWWVAMPVNNMALEQGAYVTVLEKMDETGQLVYNGVVNLSVSYEEESR